MTLEVKIKCLKPRNLRLGVYDPKTSRVYLPIFWTQRSSTSRPLKPRQVLSEKGDFSKSKHPKWEGQFIPRANSLLNFYLISVDIDCVTKETWQGSRWRSTSSISWTRTFWHQEFRRLMALPRPNGQLLVRENDLVKRSTSMMKMKKNSNELMVT